MHMRFTIKSNQVQERDSEYLIRRPEACCLSGVLTHFSVQERGNRKRNLMLPHSKGPSTPHTPYPPFLNGVTLPKSLLETFMGSHLYIVY